MKKPISRLLAAALVLLIAGGTIVWLKRPTPISVVARPADRGKVESTISNTRAGTVEACQRTRLSTILGGRIEYLGVKEGDHVKRGQVLLRLWNEDQQAQARLAEAQLAVSRQRVGEACTLADNAARDAARQSELRARGFVSVGREEQARADAEARAAACATARADIAQAQARLDATRVEQRRTVLVAPFDGIVAKIVGEVGEYSTPSPPGVPTPPAIDLIDAGCVYVKAPMDEVDAPRIAPGLPVRISLDALPNRVFAAKVRRVAPVVSAVEKQARTVDVEVDFADPAATAGLLVGYSADVEIILQVREDALRVPTAALQEGKRVLVVGADGVLASRELTTGVANWEYTEVLSGLAANDRVVTSLEREGVKAGAHVIVEAPR